MTPLDRVWLDAHPLPMPAEGTDKNSRGRLLIAGGSLQVPGAIALTAEAAFRAGAGKVRMATVAPAALPLGLRMPEAGVVALPADDEGEIAPAAANILVEQMQRADCLVLGPGMYAPAGVAALAEAVLASPDESRSALIDAAALACLGDLRHLLTGWGGRVVLTPHHGEMASLCDCEAEAVAADPERLACETARRLGAVVVLKSGTTIVAAPDDGPLLYPGGGVGLATGGSGDVLAGIIGALLARGAAPIVAAGWGVWLHGEAGRRLSNRLGPIGLLARELPGEVPALMAEG